MDIDKIKICKQLLEHLSNYSIKNNSRVSGFSYSSNPSEKLEVTYENLSNIVDNLTEDIFYKTLSTFLESESNSSTSISNSELKRDYQRGDKIKNMLATVNTQLLLATL